MNVLQDLLDGHFNASVDVHNSRVGIQPNSVIVDAWEAFCKAEDAIKEYCAKQGPRQDFRFVPRKATPAMIEAYNNVPSGFGGSPPHGANVWEAMLDAVTIGPIL